MQSRGEQATSGVEITMNKLYAILSVFAAIVLLGCIGGSDQPAENETTPSSGDSTTGKTVEISIQNNAYSQTEVLLNVGDTVAWTNFDDRVHQVLIIGVKTSDALNNGERWAHRFTTAGSYEFRDTGLPYMNGVITVS